MDLFFWLTHPKKDSVDGISGGKKSEELDN